MPDKIESYKSRERNLAMCEQHGLKHWGFFTSSLIQFPVFARGLGILHPPERPSCFFWDAPILPAPAWPWSLGPRVLRVTFQPSNLSHPSHWYQHMNNLHEPFPPSETTAGCSLGVKRIINSGIFSLVHQTFLFCLGSFFSIKNK